MSKKIAVIGNNTTNLQKTKYLAKFLNEAQGENSNVSDNVDHKEVCEKCGIKFIPHLMKPLTICDKCADDI